MNWSAFLRFLGGAAVALGCASPPPLPSFWLFASRAPRFVLLSANKVEVERNKGPFDDAAAIFLCICSIRVFLHIPLQIEWRLICVFVNEKLLTARWR